jgi:hypothetical protein
VMIHHSILDLLGIESHCFFMYDISDLITKITILKSLLGSTSYLFSLLFIPRFYYSILVL